MWDFSTYEDQIAFKDDQGEQLTYLELKDECDRIYEKIGKRSLMVVLCRNTIGCLLGYISCLNHHVAVMMIDEHTPEEIVQHIVKQYHVNYIWLPKDKEVLQMYQTMYDSFDYELCVVTEQVIPIHKDLALLLPTSGSTGNVKYVKISYHNIEANMKSIATYLQLNQLERPITMLPFHYTYGLSIIHSHLFVGATILVTSLKVIQPRFWEFFRQAKGTSISGVPYTYEILKKLNIHKMSLPFLRTMTQAGGKLSKDLHRFFASYANDTKRQFIVMYGQTEATARISYLPHDKTMEKIGSVGIAIPGGTLSILDEEQHQVTSPYTKGELVYEGDNVTMGYACGANDLLMGDERNRILRTGDYGYYDCDGYFFIEGRKDRFVKIYGNRLNLDDLEAMLQEKNQISDIACVAEDNKIFVFYTDDETKEKIGAYLTKSIGLDERYYEYISIEQLPRNEQGKIQYRLLKQQLGCGEE